MNTLQTHSPALLQFCDAVAPLPVVTAYRAGYAYAEACREAGGNIDITMSKEIEDLYNGTTTPCGRYHDAVEADLIEQAWNEGVIAAWEGHDPMSDIQIMITFD